jgi:transcriptional repressor NrdR
VVDSRLSPDGDKVRRRRECISCSERFTTYEVADRVMPRMVKSDGRRQTFDESKLRAGIMRALEKRPISTEQVESLVGRVIRRALAAAEREVTTGQVGEWVMAELRELDQVAYVRFASVYRSFQDVDAFRKEVERLKLEDGPPHPKPGTDLEG